VQAHRWTRRVVDAAFSIERVQAMFEDIHKIDSAVFKPDPTKAKSVRDGKPRKRREVGEKNVKSSSVVEADEIEFASTDEENKEHPFLDIRV
jgi:hypothetical protein